MQPPLWLNLSPRRLRPPQRRLERSLFPRSRLRLRGRQALLKLLLVLRRARPPRCVPVPQGLPCHRRCPDSRKSALIGVLLRCVALHRVRLLRRGPRGRVPRRQGGLCARSLVVQVRHAPKALERRLCRLEDPDSLRPALRV